MKVMWLLMYYFVYRCILRPIMLSEYFDQDQK